MTAQLKGVAAYSAQSYASIERIARSVRAKLAPDLAPDQALDVLHLYEHLDDFKIAMRGGRTIRLTYGVAELPAGLEAHAQYAESERAIVVELDDGPYSDLCRGARRPRFTVTHEVGHAVMHAAELVDRARTNTELRGLARGAPAHKAFLDTEWQANTFAAALLVPARGLQALEKRRVLDASAIAEAFDVSMEAATVRLRMYSTRKQELLRA